MTAKQEKQFIALSPSLTGFPSYLIPLLDLKYSDTYMMAGGLANHVCTYDTKASFELPSPVGPEACRAQPHMIQYQDLSKIRWPKMITYPLQANSSGGVFFVNAEAEVSSFSVESQGFARIGHLPDFVRYCLASVIKRQDWFVNYQRGHLLNEFGLLHVRDAGID
jgi:hypothetical protein